MGQQRACVWVGIVGPDGSGKSAVASQLVEELRSRGLAVAHTHGRPQTLFRRVPPPEADPTAPQAAAPRRAALSLAKYLLAAADFIVSRRRIRRSVDIWLSERPLLDYQVDPVRYQLASRTLWFVEALNRFVALPDRIVFLDGDPGTMAARKPELSAAEIERQLVKWRSLQHRSGARFLRLETTNGTSPEELARMVAEQIGGSWQLRWRRAPVKPGRLDVRFTGSDVSALDIYRPIRGIARIVEALGRSAIRLMLTPSAPPPHPGINDLIRALEGEGERFTGIAAMASSAPGRWIVGLARGRGLRYVAKVGRGDDGGLATEIANLARLSREPMAGLQVPETRKLGPVDGAKVLLMVAPAGDLDSVTDVGSAMEVACSLARAGWTHGDFAPWNLFEDRNGRWCLLDWETAEPTLQPLSDMVHFLLRLGATTHERDGRAGLRALATAHPRFGPLYEASSVPADPRPIAEHLSQHLDRTENQIMSSRESELRTHLRRLLYSGLTR